MSVIEANCRLKLTVFSVLYVLEDSNFGLLVLLSWCLRERKKSVPLGVVTVACAPSGSRFMNAYGIDSSFFHDLARAVLCGAVL